MSDDIRKRFWKALDASPIVMLRLEGATDHALPMTAQLDPAADSCFWFFTARDSRIARGGPALAQFESRGHDLFASVAGHLVEEKDEIVIDAHWSSEVAAWYPGGRGDPTLLLLRFDLVDAEIWERSGSVAGLLSRLAGFAIDREHAGRHERTAL